jgi:hypothetical protein
MGIHVYMSTAALNDFSRCHCGPVGHQSSIIIDSRPQRQSLGLVAAASAALATLSSTMTQL